MFAGVTEIKEREKDIISTLNSLKEQYPDYYKGNLTKEESMEFMEILKKKGLSNLRVNPLYVTEETYFSTNRTIALQKVPHAFPALMHKIEYFSIIYVRSGEISVTCENERYMYRVTKGNFIFIPPYLEFSCYIPDGTDYEQILVQASGFILRNLNFICENTLLAHFFGSTEAYLIANGIIDGKPLAKEATSNSGLEFLFPIHCETDPSDIIEQDIEYLKNIYYNRRYREKNKSSMPISEDELKYYYVDQKANLAFCNLLYDISVIQHDILPININWELHLKLYKIIKKIYFTDYKIISVKEVGDEIGKSAKTVERFVTESMGISFKQLRELIYVKKACRVMRGRTELSDEAIAKMLGYSTKAFQEMFFRNMNITTKMYRQKM